MATETKKPNIRDIVFNHIGFNPTKEQQVIIDSPYRFNLVAGGEQAGKSMIASKYLLYQYFLHDEDKYGPALYWLVAADYERTRAEFEYLRDNFTELGLLAECSKRVDPGHMIMKDGTRIETKSAKDHRTLAMKAPNGILGCEASQLDLDTFHRLMGRCAPKKGWLFLSGTFEGSLGWYPQMYTAWASGADKEARAYSLPSWTNINLYPEGRDDPEIKRLESLSSDDFFMERIAGKPSPPRGLVFPEFRPDIHVGDVEYEKGEPVHIWLDPGYAGAYALIAVQFNGEQVRIIDEIYEQALITDEIIDIATAKPWWGDVQFGVIDVAGNQHQAMAAPAELWLDKAGLYMSSQKIKINEGTERLKSWLKIDPSTHEARVVIHPKCQGILSEFGASPNPFDGQTKAYRWKTDREGNIVGEVPEDKYNHSVKALIYGLVDRFGYGFVQNQSTIRVKRWA